MVAWTSVDDTEVIPVSRIVWLPEINHTSEGLPSAVTVTVSVRSMLLFPPPLTAVMAG
jgi:hypothetical protein